MLLTLTTTHRPATDLGYLLGKHPARCQRFGLNHGAAHVFFPEATEARCTAALLLELDPIALVRGQAGARDGGLLSSYVNDRPYVASSFFSVAMTRVLRSAMSGVCSSRPELAASAIPLVARLEPLPAPGDGELVRELFEPLGYEVSLERLPLDPAFPDWGESRYVALELRAERPLSELLTHLYVLTPVLDGDKHYWIGADELEKLLARGEGWLEQHPLRERIAHRYLARKPRLAREAIARLVGDDAERADREAEAQAAAEAELERPLSLHEQRHEAVVRVLAEVGARRVLDLGCNDGRLLARLRGERQLSELVGLDVSPVALDRAERRLKLDRASEAERERIRLLQGSLLYRDRRLRGYDAACLVEVVEHLDPGRLEAMELSVFDYARPETVIVTTPNRAYNALFDNLPASGLRHGDHRFEWDEAEFAAWSDGVATRHGYAVRREGVGEPHETLGAPTQLAVFER